MTGSLTKLVYVVETPDEIFWSERKMETQYKHIEFLWRDKARFKELTRNQWRLLKKRTKKRIWEITDG